MPTYRLLQINDPNGDYWVVVSDEEIKRKDLYEYEEKVARRLTFNDPAGIYSTQFRKVIAQSRQVHEGIALFELPDELNQYTEEDMRNAFNSGHDYAADPLTSSALELPKNAKEYIQSLNKPKQYEVEIEEFYNCSEQEGREMSKKERELFIEPRIRNGKVTITKVKQI